MMTLSSTAFSATCEWPAWRQFSERYIDAGRVIDGSDPRQISTSEGQAYALFFALLANDRKTFSELLNWTEQYLAQGDLAARLPAWLWGRDEDGLQRVLDDNAAADADSWLAFTLSEAGRLWGNHNYRTLGYFLAQRIASEESAILDDGRRLLLPAPAGFVSEGQLTVNPSYWMPQLFYRLASLYPHSHWPALADAAAELLVETAPRGLSPDWSVRNAEGWQGGGKTSGRGSYDAIRVYLWLGMLHPNSPQREELLAHFSPMLALARAAGEPPEWVNAYSGGAGGEGPWGFSAALLPLLMTGGESDFLDAQQQRVLAARERSRGRRDYYNRVLDLFADGWRSGRLRFAGDGKLMVNWSRCS